MSDSNDSSAPQRPRINPLTIWAIIILMVGGMVVFYQYLLKLKHDSQPQNTRLPILKRVEKSIEVTEQSGRKVETGELKGKIIIACYVYTRCPRGCAGVVGELHKLYKEIGNDPNIHFLSVSVDPDDTPEHMREFTKNFGVQNDNWWFVNGEKDELRVYMSRYFGFLDVQEIPEGDRLSPDDKFMHDMKVALVDHKAQLRGMYDIASADPEFAKYWREKLRKDIETLRKDQADEAKK